MHFGASTFLIFYLHRFLQSKTASSKGALWYKFSEQHRYKTIKKNTTKLAPSWCSDLIQISVGYILPEMVHIRIEYHECRLHGDLDLAGIPHKMET